MYHNETDTPARARWVRARAQFKFNLFEHVHCVYFYSMNNQELCPYSVHTDSRFHAHRVSLFVIA